MLSILIPVYNYNVYPLVEKLHDQLQQLEIDYEIKVFDDCSITPSGENEKINALNGASYIVLKNNIGRSAIRNLLAKEASFDNLLFLDADTMIINTDFISTYLEVIKDAYQIISGGILYHKEKPESHKVLRWTYGIQREALTVSERNKKPHLRFLSLNFIVKKSVFNILKFNEEIPNLRHEDTLFGFEAKQKRITITHIDNPVMHLGIESSNDFLKKSEEAIDAIKLFVHQGLIPKEEVKLSKIAFKIKRWGLSNIFAVLHNIFKHKMKANLLSHKPSLIIFDLYRLGYFCSLNRDKDA